MKLTKLSLVAALLIGSSAMAFENTKVTGDANLFYQTQDNSGTQGVFESGTSSADMSVNLNLTTDVLKTDSVAVSAGLGYTVLTTLGLEGQMVDGVWGNAHNGAGTVTWTNEAWFAATSANTTVKIGRMELDTPLAFTETWSIEKNTFESAVLINQDIPSTTLVAAYVGRGNGAGQTGTGGATGGVSTGGIVAVNGEFSNYGGKGTYALGAINNSWEPLTVQAWYYDLVALAQASWLQADLSMANVIAGLQYTTLDVAGAQSTAAAAMMVGYEMKDTVTAKLAYSKVSSKGAAAYNTATGATTGQTKMYTEVWWNYGQVTQAGAESIQLFVEAPTSVADFSLYATTVDQVAANSDLTEIALAASKSFGPLDATVVYINTSVDGSDADNMLQVYLTANF